MITERFPRAELSRLLLSREELRPYPSIDQREAWRALSPLVRAGLVARGETALEREFPALPATAYLEFVRTGSRQAQERCTLPRRDILLDLVLAECCENQGRFVDSIIDALWAICEETYWGLSAHVSAQKAGAGLPDSEEPTVDLFAAETGALLAWVLFLLGGRFDSVSPLIRRRILHELELRVLTPCLERDDFWWMGNSNRALNNWTPWICSNWMTVALLAEADAERRATAVSRALACTDRFLAQHPPDGGCDEGPSYWHRAGASVFDCLDILHWATGGKADLFDEPLVRNLGAYICTAHIHARWFMNFADCGAKLLPEASLIWRFGKLCGNPAMMQLATYCSQMESGEKRRGSISRVLPSLFGGVDFGDAAVSAPYLRDIWLPDLQVMVARCQEGTEKGFFVAAKGGHNAESHNHNDVGNVIVFHDGNPVIIDAGVDTYTAKTFSAQRYELWTMQSAYHTLPTINGCQQIPGGKARAENAEYARDAELARLEMEIKDAYPQEAGIESWRRAITLQRKEWMEINDTYRLGQAASLEWNLLTPCAVAEADRGLRLDGRLLLAFDKSKYRCEVESIDIGDGNLCSVWGDTGLKRIRVVALDLQAVGTATFRLFPEN